MKVRVLVAAVSFCLAATYESSGVAAQERGLSRREVKTLIVTAKSEEQFAQLEKYFHQRADRFHSLEHSEKLEMKYALEASPSFKSPSAYDQARNLESYYATEYQAAEAAEKLYRGKRDLARQASAERGSR